MFVVPHPPGPVLSRIGTQSRPLAVSVGGCLFITIPKCDAQRRQREYWHTVSLGWHALKSNCLHTASGIESGTPLELRKQRAPLLAQRLCNAALEVAQRRASLG